MKQISIIGPSGVGKTTTLNIMNDRLLTNYFVKICKLSKPIYKIQGLLYDYLDYPIEGKQDGELLQFLGAKIQEIKPTYLSDKFFAEIDNFTSVFNSDEKIIILNDDCRPHNYQALKDRGFYFIGILGDSRQRSDDITCHKLNHKVEWQGFDHIEKCDIVLQNNGSIKDLVKKTEQLLKAIL